MNTDNNHIEDIPISSTKNIDGKNEIRLNEIKSELKSLFSEDNSNWVKMYQLLYEVKSKKLYLPEYKNFTQFVKQVSFDLKIHVSLIWRRYKAGKTYDEYLKTKPQNTPILTLEQSGLSAESLVFIDKISGKNSTIRNDLINKCINHELTKSDLAAIYNSKKGSNSIPKNGYDLRKKYAQSENEEIEDENKITASDIIVALKNAPDKNNLFFSKYPVDNGLKTNKSAGYIQPKYYLYPEFPVYNGESRHSRRIDAVIAENISVPYYSACLRGVEIKVDKYDLIKDEKMEEYADFCDYMYLAIPYYLKDIARDYIVSEFGILLISKTADDSFEIKVDREPTKLNPTCKEQSLITFLWKYQNIR